MKTQRILFLLVFVVSLLTVPPLASAGSPAEDQVTGGAWFQSWYLPPRKVYGGLCYTSLVAKQQDGVWSGRGRFMDMESPFDGKRRVAILTVESGSFHDEFDDLFPVGTVWYYLEGTAQYYEDNVYLGPISFLLRFVDYGPVPDGIVETIGVRLAVYGGDPYNLDDVFYRAGSKTDELNLQGMFRIG